MDLYKRLISLSLAALATACGSQATSPASRTTEAWNPANDPARFDVRVARLEALPKSGMLSDEAYPWSDDYWGTYSGGISKRWQLATSGHGNYRDYLYTFLTPQQVKNHVNGGAPLPVAVAKLSPAEKYDLLSGRYDFPLAQGERENTLASVDPATGDVPHWFGLCHGWAPATLAEPEPGNVAVVRNADGLEIPFYTSDINALMTKIYADYLGGERFVGSRCNRDSNAIKTDSTGRIIPPECRDTNPGTLHLTLAQLLGNPDVSRREGFVADVTMSSEVWNQAVSGYKVVSQSVRAFNPATDPRAAHRAPGTVRLADVRTRLYYISEIAPHLTPRKDDAEQYTSSMDLDYTLELDAEGTIIGGEWNSDEIPDFLWKATSTPDTGGSYLDYAKVRALLDASRQ